MRSNKSVLFTLLMTAAITAFGQKGEIIYEFRGVDRTGIFDEKNLLKEWPAEGPRELYTIDNLGNGYGSPVFTESEFFVTGEIDSTGFVYCFDLKGNKKWETELGPEWMRSYPGGRDAPTVAGNRVYIGTGVGDLFCLDRASGKILWTRRLKDDFDGVLPLHGYSEAPLIDGDRIFWTPGGKVNNVVALNRFTGDLIWANKGFGEAMGYNQARLIRLPARNIVVTFSSYHLMGFDSATGEMIWSHEQDNLPVEKRKPGYGDTHCNTVIYENGYIWYVAGDGNSAVKLALSGDGKRITEVWRSKNLNGYMGGIVKIGDYIYGDVQLRPGLHSISAITGEKADSLLNGDGSVIAADGMIYYYNTRGTVHLIKPTDGKMQIVSTFKVTKGTKEHFAHLTINKGILYVRRGNALIAYDIRYGV